MKRLLIMITTTARAFDAEFGAGAAARDAGQFFALLPWLLVLCAGLMAFAAAVDG